MDYKSVLYTVKIYSIIILILILMCSTASAVTHTVCDSGCDFTMIQDAVTAANSYDIIEVQAGTYSENVDILTARLTIKGSGMTTTHVEAAASAFHVFNVAASYTNITGMNITGVIASNALIYLNGNYDYCNFSYNRIANGYDGIVVRGAGNDHNLILNNTFPSHIEDCAIMIKDGTYNNVTKNHIHHCVLGVFFQDIGIGCYAYRNWVKHNDYGLYQCGSATESCFFDNWVENCTLQALGGAGMSWHVSKRSGTNIFGGNYIGGNYWADYAGVDDDNNGLGDTLTPYTNGGNITVGGDSNPLCTAAGSGGSSARNCAYGDICVNQTHWWRDDAPINSSSDPIAAGIAAAVSYQTVYVFNGTYTENIAETDTHNLTVIGEGRNVVHITPNNNNNHIFHITNDADHFYLSGIHASGGTTNSIGIYFWHVTHGHVTNCNFTKCGCGIAGEYGNYMRIEGNIVANALLRDISFPYYNNNSYFADNIITGAGARGLDLCTHGDNSVFRNNTVLYNGLPASGSHASGINTHWSDNVLYDECRTYGNYGYRDHLIRNDANNITIRNPTNIIGEVLDFDIEDVDCEWKIENTDGQIFTENSGATAYAYPENFSMQRKNVAETFTITLTPMTLLSTDDQVSVTNIDYNNAMYSEGYCITVDCTDALETVTFTAHVANTTGEYMCYLDGLIDHSETAINGVVTWTYNGGLATSKAMSIMWLAGGGEPNTFIPPAPINLQTSNGILVNTTFWINHTWAPGYGNVSDSYNVSVNQTWYNDSIHTYFNNSYSKYDWQNISVWAYNNTLQLSTNCITQNTQAKLYRSTTFNLSSIINILNQIPYIIYPITGILSSLAQILIYGIVISFSIGIIYYLKRYIINIINFRKRI